MKGLVERLEKIRGDAETVVLGLICAALVVAVSVGVYYSSLAKKRFMQELYAQDSGTKIAYIADSRTIKVIPIEDITKKDATEYRPQNASIDALLWTSDNASLCYLNDIGTVFDTKHQIVRYDFSTGAQTVLVDLTKETFPDDDVCELRLDDQRVFFKLGTGEWYSVRQDDPVPRREPEQSGIDQKHCPHQTYSCISKTPGKQSTQVFVVKDNEQYSVGYGEGPVWSPTESK